MVNCSTILNKLNHFAEGYRVEVLNDSSFMKYHLNSVRVKGTYS